MIRWFRSRRRLHEDLRLLNVIIADHEQTIARLNKEMGEHEAVTEIRVAQLQQSLDLADRAFDQLSEMLIARETKLARVVEELKALREDIRQAEESSNLPAATGVGMARAADRPLVWQVADAINEDAAAKRREDGLGDPA
jgi:uncharacterized coiled-coil protein SlyX